MLEINQYQNRGLIWYGNKNDQLEGRIKSGYDKLDQALSGGFPPQGVVEIKTPMGIGELRVMLPYIRQKQTLGMVVFIGPPAQLDAEFLLANDIDLNHILLITEYGAEGMLWAAEQCLKSGCCGAVILWQKKLSIKQSRRLLLASEQGGSSLLLYRLQERRNQHSVFALPSHVSLSLSSAAEGLLVDIDKQRGGKTVKGILVDMRDQWPALTSTSVSDNNVVTFPQRLAH